MNLHLKDRLDIKFTASQGELMPEALTFTYLTHIVSLRVMHNYRGAK